MKNLMILILFFLSINNLSAQKDVSNVLTIKNLVDLSNMSLENADRWLTKENDFTFMSRSKKYKASIYAFDYNEELKTSHMWLYNFDKINEIFIITKKKDIDNIYQNLE